MKKRGFQRSKVYKAENHHSLWKESVQSWSHGASGSLVIATADKFTDGTSLMSYNETKAFVEKIMRSRWWKSRMPHVDRLKLKDGRGTRWARGYRNINRIVLNIPRWARQPLVILHEMAHTMTPNSHITPSHGPIFCANNLDLVKRWIGKDAWLEMKSLYKQYKVKFRRTK